MPLTCLATLPMFVFLIDLKSVKNGGGGLRGDFRSERY